MKTKVVTALSAAAIFIGATMGAHAAAPPTAKQVNIFGASAQYLFWNDVADDFLKATTAQGGANCTPATVEGPMAKGSTDGITWGYNCTNITGSPNVIIRYSSGNSCDGLRAVAGTVANGCSSARQRLMADEATCSGSTCSSTKCITVTHGASDVEGSSLAQSSEGEDFGRCQGGWKSYGPCGANVSGFTSYNPFVVPFGFFANKAVTQKRCQTSAGVRGEVCDVAASDCATGETCTAGEPELSRLMAVMIFSKQAFEWGDFGTSFPASLPIEACLRHAGSGTHATLALGVMRGNDWGWGVAAAQEPATLSYFTGSYPPPSQYATWFNYGSSDMMKCVDGRYYTGSACSSAGQDMGAIGYADADQSLSSYPKVWGPLKYNGYKPLARNIKAGLYDNFWSKQWLYENCGGDSACHDIMSKLVSYSSTKVPSTKANFWVPIADMKFMKAHDDSYPGL